MTNSIAIDRAAYNRLMEDGAEGTKISQEQFDALKAFAKEKRIKQPKAEWVAEPKPAKAPKAPKAPKEPKPKAKCSVEGCEKDSRVGGMCSADWTRLVYRADKEVAEKARASSKAYAARKRAEAKAEREAAAAAAASEETSAA